MIFLHAIHVAFWLYKVMCFVFVFFFIKFGKFSYRTFFLKNGGGTFSGSSSVAP